MLFTLPLLAIASFVSGSPVIKPKNSATLLKGTDFYAADIKAVQIFTDPVATNHILGSIPATSAHVQVCPNYQNDCCIKNSDGSSTCQHASTCCGTKAKLVQAPFTCQAEALTKCLVEDGLGAAATCVATGIETLSAGCVVALVGAGLSAIFCLWDNCVM